MTIKERIDRLSPNTKRNLAIGFTVVAVGFLMFIATSSTSDGPRERGQSRPPIGAVLTDDDPRALGLGSMATQIRQLQTSQTRIERSLERITDKTDEESQIADLQAQLETVHQTLAKLEEGGIRPQEAESAPTDLAPEESRTPNIFQGRDGQRPQTTSSVEDLTNVFENLPEPPPVDPRTRSTERDQQPKIRRIGGAPDDASAADKEQLTINLPSGSILSGVLITGMDAPTANNAQRDPFPTLLRIKHEAILPNRFRADFRECMLIAGGYGDLSSERAYMRAETISCIRNDGQVLESSLDAYATGEDGKAGVRGRLVSKQGQVIARSLAAGFMQGIASAFDVREVPSINITRDTGGNTNSPVYEQAVNSRTVQGAGARGVGTAMERIADYYLAMAENIFPVIEIDAMREVDFIVKRGMTINLSPVSTSNTAVNTSNTAVN